MREDIEAIQRRAARFVTGKFDHHTSVTEMLQELGWESLEERRRSFRESLLRKFREPAFEADCRKIVLPPNIHCARTVVSSLFYLRVEQEGK